MSKKKIYVNYLTILFCLIVGLKTLSEECVTFFSDELIHDLHFTTSQYSSMSSLFYLSYGVSTIVIGMLTGRSSKRKAWVFPMTLMVGLISVAASLARDYPGLAVCRFATGIFTGSSQAIMLDILAKNLVKNDYGMRSGIISSGAKLFSSALGPVLLAVLTQRYAWNAAFLLIGIALVILSFLILTTVREVHFEVKGKTSLSDGGLLASLKELVKNRVFVLCFVIGLLETTGNLCLAVFTPLYYSEVMGLGAVDKAAFISLKGICFIPVSLIVPFLVDRFPVHKVMSVIFAGAAIAPGAAFFFGGTEFSTYPLAVFGAWAGVTVALFTYIIPRMVLPEHLCMQASGIILGSAVLLGGCAAPQTMSLLIEMGWEIQQVIGLCGLFFVICTILSLMIKLPTHTPSR